MLSSHDTIDVIYQQNAVLSENIFILLVQSPLIMMFYTSSRAKWYYAIPNDSRNAENYCVTKFIVIVSATMCSEGTFFT